MNTNYKYWMVNNTQSGACVNLHYTAKDARLEAIRLAEKYPGRLYFVLEAVECYCVVDPKASRVELLSPKDG